MFTTSATASAIAAAAMMCADGFQPQAVAAASPGVHAAALTSTDDAERVPGERLSPEARAAVLGGTSGADVAVCQMVITQSWGRVGDIHAFSVRTDSWNVGDTLLIWEEENNWHPVIAQNMYRYRDGRIEMIGMSWLKHGFCALQQTGCGECNTMQGCPQWLQPGCRDPYSANLNGNQMRLGPRSEVDASRGQFPYPYKLGWAQTGDAVYKRLQVHDDDLNPALNDGARYYIEGQYVHIQEGVSPRRHNNASYEEVAPTPNGDTYNLGLGMNTVQLLPAIYAWQDNDPAVVIEAVDVPGTPVDGRFHIGYRVHNNGDGTWQYEYAVRNMNSHRSARAFTVPVAHIDSVLGTFHRDIKYHSGEVYTDEDWVTSIAPASVSGGAGSVSWEGDEFANNPNANVLRWGTMFNFSLTADAPPVTGEVTLALFRPGEGGELQIPALVPGTCVGDLNADGTVDILDVLTLFSAWGDCLGCAADLNGDDAVDVLDLLIAFSAWGDCP